MRKTNKMFLFFLSPVFSCDSDSYQLWTLIYLFNLVIFKGNLKVDTDLLVS